MMTRARQLQLALLLPVGFLAARAIYAVLFGGARNGDDLLIDVAAISLTGPFAHISLLGPIYLDALIANLATALPFALFMLVTGIAVIFVRPARLFAMAQQAPAFRPILSALAIGWVQIPALTQATVRISRALKLRRERRFRAIMPVLETAISTALAMAQRIALSGANHHSHSDQLRMVDLSVVEAGLRSINITLEKGECLVISGPTGSGKSSLLLAATGLASELGLTLSGTLITPDQIGYVSQQPRAQLFGPLVSDEIQPTTLFELGEKINRPVHLLSEGEALQVSMVRELQKQPKLLILDEPYSGLDDLACQMLTGLLRDYQSSGGALLIAEHRPELLAEVATAEGHIRSGELHPGNQPCEFTSGIRRPTLLTSDKVLHFEVESIGHPGKLLISSPKLSVHQSEIIAITGLNGAGKTSLLNAIESSCDFAVLVPELAADFFVTTSVNDELERADRIAKVEAGFTANNLISILGELPNLDTHPRDLSAGTQLALAISMQLSHKPKILLIDEPARGFDAQTKAQVVATLECVRETGCAVVFASHDSQLIEALATSVYSIANLELREIGRVLA
jgi:energy-coupling factor transporter ATP-binding protein EcfA2